MVRKTVYWIPRILSVVLVVLLAFFALHTIDEGGTLGETFGRLVVSFIPVAILAFILVLTWNWDWIGAVVFIGFAVADLFFRWDFFTGPGYMVVAIVFLVFGFLFLTDWILSSKKFT